MNIKNFKDIPPWQWPKNAGKTFLDVLHDDQAHGSDRLLAAELAGDWEIDAAWPHIAALVASEGTEKELLLAAIEAAVFILPDKASEILSPLLESDDEDIVDAVYEAMAMAGEIDEDEEDDDEGPKTFH